MHTRGDLLSFAIAFALRGARKKRFGAKAAIKQLDRLLFFRLRTVVAPGGRRPNCFVLGNSDHAGDRLIDHVDDRVFDDRHALSWRFFWCHFCLWWPLFWHRALYCLLARRLGTCLLGVAIRFFALAIAIS
jgi:hypothetical protein